MTKIEKKEPFPAGSKTWPPTPMSNLFNLRAGNKLRLKAKINWLGWRINNYYHKNAQKNKNWRKETNIEMSPMPNIKHTLAILTNSLDTMYCQQRKNGESSKQSRNPMSQFFLGICRIFLNSDSLTKGKIIVKNILPLQFIVFHQQFALIT